MTDGLLPYDPHADAASRPDVEIGYGPLPEKVHGLTVVEDGVAWIVLREGMSPDLERAALAEELVHSERAVRGHVLPSDDPRDPLNKREEKLVRVIAALRLFTLWPVLQMFRELRASGDCNPWLYAEEHGIPPHLFKELLDWLGQVIGPVYPWWATDAQGAG